MDLSQMTADLVQAEMLLAAGQAEIGRAHV